VRPSPALGSARSLREGPQRRKTSDLRDAPRFRRAFSAEFSHLELGSRRSSTPGPQLFSGRSEFFLSKPEMENCNLGVAGVRPCTFFLRGRSSRCPREEMVNSSGGENSCDAGEKRCDLAHQELRRWSSTSPPFQGFPANEPLGDEAPSGRKSHGTDCAPGISPRWSTRALYVKDEAGGAAAQSVLRMKYRDAAAPALRKCSALARPGIRLDRAPVPAGVPL
jgi:hypothetical protein